MQPRRAGQYAREKTHRMAAQGLAATVTVVAVGVLVAFVYGIPSTELLVAEVFAIAALWLIDRVWCRSLERWSRGAAGEEHVGAVIDALRPNGWRAIHDVSLGRGNVDHLLIGPAGLLTIETRHCTPGSSPHSPDVTSAATSLPRGR